MHSTGNHDDRPREAVVFNEVGRVRRLERAVVRGARRLGIERPDCYALPPDTPTHNCLAPVAVKIFFMLSAAECPRDLIPTARRMCQSVAVTHGGQS